MVYDIAIEVKNDYIQVVVKGVSSLSNNIDLQKKVIQACTEKQVNKVLVDIRELKRPTSISEIYQFGKEAGPGLRSMLLKAAVLHDEARADHESFLETTMKNRGVNLKSFMSEEEAVNWLKG